MKPKSLFFIVVFMATGFVSAQCPNENVEIWKKNVAAYPDREDFTIMAEYHELLCECLNGTQFPERLMEKVNNLSDRYAAVKNSKGPRKVIRCAERNEPETENFIQWNGKKEAFEGISYQGSTYAFPKLLLLYHSNIDGKKFQIIRITNMQTLAADGVITGRAGTPGDIGVGIIDQENDNYYFQSKTATMKGLGDNRYELIANMSFVGGAGNDFQTGYFPDYELKITFSFDPIFEMD